MSGILAIGPSEKEHIKAAIEIARAKPIPWKVAQELMVDADDSGRLLLEARGSKDARIREIKREYPSQNVILGTYRAALSFEEQPAGMMRHLSVSSRLPGKVPGEHVMAMVVEAFGFSAFPPIRPWKVWVEEFEPGHHAVNIVELEPSDA